MVANNNYYGGIEQQMRRNVYFNARVKKKKTKTKPNTCIHQIKQIIL